MFTFRYFWLFLSVALLAAALPACASQSANQIRSELNDALLAKDAIRAKKIIESEPIPKHYIAGACWYQFATLEGMPELFEPLKDAGVPIECMDIGGTPLQDAIFTRHYRAARELIRLGANLNPRLGPTKSNSYLPYPPLSQVIIYYTQGKLHGGTLNKKKPASVRRTEEKLIKYMLDQGADPSAVNKKGDATALTIAAGQGATQIVKWLLQAGADPNQLIRDKTSSASALEVAILGGNSNIETVKTLLYAGADPTIGTYAEHLTEKAKKTMPQAVPLLKQYGAR